MNKYFIVDWTSYISFRILSFFLKMLPCGLKFFLARRLGNLLYYLDAKHRCLAYANVKRALGKSLTPQELSKIVKKFYQHSGSTLMEFFLLPLVDKSYIDKYITFEGLDNIALGFKGGKGVILAVVHECNWEISNVISANLGYSFSILIRQQEKYQHLNNLLNSYRASKGTKLIQTQNQTRELITVLKNNEAVAMTADQGGSAGVLVNFFGRSASMPTGAIKLALRYGCAIIPVFSRRLKGPRIKFMVGEPLEIKQGGDIEKDVQENLQRLILIFEKYIRLYPQEYLWTYKIWKYSNERNILILSDGKAGHLRQAQKVAEIASDILREQGMTAKVVTQEARIKNKSPVTIVSDIIISCGSLLAPINYRLSKENLAKSIIIMRPSLMSTRRFDLAIIPRHDRPPKRKNIAATEGSLNLIDGEYLKEQSERLIQNLKLKIKNFCISLLIGGDSKNFSLDTKVISEVIKQLKASSEKLNADILVTTSRRTSVEIEKLVKLEFQNYPRCKLLVLANEKNIPEAVGGMLGLSRVIVTSPESISMISEASNSKRYVFVFRQEKGLSRKHKRFLKHFVENKYIYLSEAVQLSSKIEEVCLHQPEILSPRDNSLVREAIKKIL